MSKALGSSPRTVKRADEGQGREQRGGGRWKRGGERKREGEGDVKPDALRWIH